MKIYLFNNDDNWQLYDDDVCDLDAELKKRGLILSKEAKIHAPFYFAGGKVFGGEIFGGIIWGGEIWGGEIWGGEIFGGVIRGGKIWDGVISGGEIWDGEICDGEIFGGVIRGGKILGGEIFGGEIFGGVIMGGKIRGGEIKRTPLQIHGSRYFLLWNKDTDRVSIGYHTKTVDGWLREFDKISIDDFTDEEKNEYRQYLLMIENMMNTEEK
mgnify:FL=1